MKAVVGAIHRRGWTCVGVRVGDTVHKESIPSYGTSADEAVLRGWIRGIEVAREQGATEVSIVVNRPVLEGHLRLGWQVRSLNLLRSWREFAEKASDLSPTFLYKSRRPGSERTTVGDAVVPRT